MSNWRLKPFYNYCHYLIVTCACIAVTGSDRHKVLLFPSPFYSHTVSVYAIGRELINQGHVVHMLQHWSFKVPPKWLEDGKLVVHRYGRPERGGYDVEEYVANLTREYLEFGHGFDFYLDKMQQLSRSLTVDMLTDNDELIDELKSHHFDVAVVESVFFMRFSCLIPHELQVPMVTYSDSINPWLVRMPWLPSIFSPMRMSTDTKNGFFKRLSNLLTFISLKLFPHSPDLDETLLDRYRQSGPFDTLEDIISKSALFLVPGDPAMDVVRPSTANVIFVGGLTTDLLRVSPGGILPEEYESFISDDDRPTVLVSFGSMVYWYPERLASTLVEAFRLLPRFKFIWRFPNDHELAVPDNVMVVKWMPQAELMARPEVKLFVTHSGNNGQFESLYHGVPMLAVPLFTDQIRNAKRIVERGYGQRIDYRSASPELFAASIEKIVEDESYSVRIKKASAMFKDSPQTPSQRAAFWIGHVVKHGAEHLRPTGNDLYFWQYLCVDVVLFCLAACASLLFTVYILSKYYIGRLLPQRTPNPVERSKKFY